MRSSSHSRPHKHSCNNEGTMSSLRVLASGTRLSHEIEIKRSRFIASIARTDTPEEAREFINSVKDAHPQARHNCSAWMIAEEGHSPSQHSSDDGEPSGTAGTPMLDVLKRNELWNVTVVVTRYFGGILLGAGGLVRAYSSATSEALALASFARLEALTVVETELDPIDAGRIEAELRRMGAQVLSTEWGQSVLMRLAMTPEQLESAIALLANLSSGKYFFRELGQRYIEIAE